MSDLLTSPPCLTRFARCIACVARCLAVFFGPELPLFDLARGSVGLSLRSGIRLGLPLCLFVRGGLPFELALGFGGCDSGAGDSGTLFRGCLIASLPASGTLRRYSFIDRRPGTIRGQSSHSGTGGGILSFLESGVLESRHLNFAILSEVAMAKVAPQKSPPILSRIQIRPRYRERTCAGGSVKSLSDRRKRHCRVDIGSWASLANP
jgi:hypothetical protein